MSKKISNLLKGTGTFLFDGVEKIGEGASDLGVKTLNGTLDFISFFFIPSEIYDEVEDVVNLVDERGVNTYTIFEISPGWVSKQQMRNAYSEYLRSQKVHHWVKQECGRLLGRDDVRVRNYVRESLKEYSEGLNEYVRSVRQDV